MCRFYIYRFISLLTNSVLLLVKRYINITTYINKKMKHNYILMSDNSHSLIAHAIESKLARFIQRGCTTLRRDAGEVGLFRLLLKTTSINSNSKLLSCATMCWHHNFPFNVQTLLSSSANVNNQCNITVCLCATQHVCKALCSAASGNLQL